MRTIGLVNGTPLTTATRMSVISSLLGELFRLTFRVLSDTWSSIGWSRIDASETPASPAPAACSTERRPTGPVIVPTRLNGDMDAPPKFDVGGSHRYRRTLTRTISEWSDRVSRYCWLVRAFHP